MNGNDFQIALEEASPHPVGTIVHIGAGRGAELDAYLATRPQAIVLVEPRADAVEALKVRTEQIPFAQVMRAAVGEAEGKVPFHVATLAELSSAQDLDAGAAVAYPGLAVRETVTVPGLPLATLLKRISLTGKAAHALVVDAPGAEAQIARAITTEPAAKKFSMIVFRLSRASLFKQGAPARDVLKRLTDTGLELHDSWPSADPDWLWYAFGRNRLQPALDDAKAREDDARARDAEFEEALGGRKPAALVQNLEDAQSDLAQRDEQLALARGQLNVAEGQIDIIRDLLIGRPTS